MTALQCVYTEARDVWTLLEGPQEDQTLKVEATALRPTAWLGNVYCLCIIWCHKGSPSVQENLSSRLQQVGSTTSNNDLATDQQRGKGSTGGVQ